MSHLLGKKKEVGGRGGTETAWEIGLELGLWVPKELLEKVSKAAEEQLVWHLVLGHCSWEDRIES